MQTLLWYCILIISFRALPFQNESIFLLVCESRVLRFVDIFVPPSRRALRLWLSFELDLLAIFLSPGGGTPTMKSSFC